MTDGGCSRGCHHLPKTWLPLHPLSVGHAPLDGRAALEAPYTDGGRVEGAQSTASQIQCQEIAT